MKKTKQKNINKNTLKKIIFKLNIQQNEEKQTIK